MTSTTTTTTTKTTKTTTLTVTALGTGDAFSATRYSSCLLLETATTKVLVDCPHPIRKILRESTNGRVDVADLDAVVLTHLHADHASGVEGFLWFNHFVLQRKTRLVAHPAVLRGLWPMLAPSMAELLVVGEENHPHHRERLAAEDLMDAVPFAEDGVVIGDLHLTPRITVHHIPTTALRVALAASPTSPLLGYSADTAFDERLLAWLDAAPVIIHETNFGAHTPYEKLAALPPPLRDKLRLIHWSDIFDVDASVIPVLQDGDSLALPLR